MIKVQDWIASIPDEEKHIAYVGEGKSEQRTFLLCGNGWETYKDFSFHLDMAFDPTSITTRDTRQVVQTTVNSAEFKEEAGKTMDEVTKKETYTVENVSCTTHDLTDIAPLSKTVTDDGILLTWTILRQQTVLPGKLWATIRAVENPAQRVKKSAIMTFEVDPAICAVSAAVPAISEYDQMIAQMDILREQTTVAAEDASRAANDASNALQQIEQDANAVRDHAYAADRSATQARAAVQDTAAHVSQTAQYHQLTVNAAHAAEEACANTNEYMQSAASHAASAALAAQGAYENNTNSLAAVQQCSRYTQRCEDAAENTEKSLSTLKYRRVNVRDYGAVGDGVTDDRKAIVDAFAAAKAQLPCEVYFPAGIYGISNGITVNMDFGTGGLLVNGAGRDVAQIKYLDSYNPRQSGVNWYAIRIWTNNVKPTTEDDYLHDISISNLSVFDPDPCAHAIHPNKGDASKEETHGFDIQYCKRAAVTDCNIISVGDEAIDIFSCHDVVVANNHVVGSPGAGSAGGAISIGDGSKHVVVSGNTINRTAEDETLENGTVINKSNFGIAVESLATPVSDVVVTGNAIYGVRGSGVHFNTPNTGAKITNLSITDNIISGCTNGIVSSGTKPMEGLKLHDNTITDCAEYGIHLAGGIGDVTIVGNTIRNAKYGAKAIQLSSRQLYADNLFENITSTALYVRGQVTVSNCAFKDIGATTGQAAIYNDVSSATNGTLVVSGCTMTGIRSKNAIYGAHTVRDTDMEFVNENGDVVYDHNVFGGSRDAFLRNLFGGNIGGRIDIQVSNGMVSGVKLTYQGSANALQLNANKTRVIGCFIDADNGNYAAIQEKSGANHNLIANNIVNKAIVTSGAQSVAVNNIDTRAEGDTDPECEHAYDNDCAATCNLCGATREVSHSYGEDGYCTVCGQRDPSLPDVPACEHEYGNGAVTLPATCVDDGVMTYMCAKCGNIKTEVIPATGHNYVDGYCTVCGKRDTVSHPYNLDEEYPLRDTSLKGLYDLGSGADGTNDSLANHGDETANTTPTAFSGTSYTIAEDWVTFKNNASNRLLTYIRLSEEQGLTCIVLFRVKAGRRVLIGNRNGGNETWNWGVNLTNAGVEFGNNGTFDKRGFNDSAVITSEDTFAILAMTAKDDVVRVVRYQNDGLTELLNFAGMVNKWGTATSLNAVQIGGYGYSDGSMQAADISLAAIHEGVVSDPDLEKICQFVKDYGEQKGLTIE